MRLGNNSSEVDRNVLLFHPVYQTRKHRNQPIGIRQFYRNPHLATTSCAPLLSADDPIRINHNRYQYKDYDAQLKLLEKNARKKYRTAIRKLPSVESSKGFDRFLDNSIVPVFKRIGFDENFTKALFMIAMPAWKLLGSIGDNVELMHPLLMKNIEEIRSGIISTSRKKIRARSLLGEMDPQSTYTLINKTMHPAKLLDDFKDISLSWIILPRAYDLLEKDHSRNIMIYIKSLDKETDSEFTKILARIIIESVGNYSLKYIGDVHLRDQMAEALFYGYAVMFWKNLRNPPGGLEDGLIFESFFRWAKMIHNRFASTNRNMLKTIQRMQEEKEKTFPSFNIFGLAHHNEYDVYRFFVALRHGIEGVEAVARYFGIGGPLLKNKTDGKLPYVAVPKRLSFLFRQIRKRYRIETPKTRKSIHEFLFRLRANYNSDRIETVFSGGEPSETLRFVGPRILGMVQSVTESIHLRFA